MAIPQPTVVSDSLETKTCTKCGESKPESEFPYSSARRKHEARCRACKSDYAREYHAKWRAKPENKAAANLRSAQWRLDNLERERELNRKWRLENPEVKRATSKAWYESVGRARLDPVRRAEAHKRWRESNPDRFAELNRLNVKRRRARMAQVLIIPFTPDQLAARMAFYGGKCWICKVAASDGLDHVKPISKGGAHILANLRPACKSCNSSKNNAWPWREYGNRS